MNLLNRILKFLNFTYLYSSICGVKFYTDAAEETTRVALLAYHEQKWSVNLYSWPALKPESLFDCPTEPAVPSWCRRKIVIVADMLYLLATAESCSAIWTLDLVTSAWCVRVFSCDLQSQFLCFL